MPEALRRLKVIGPQRVVKAVNRQVVKGQVIQGRKRSFSCISSGSWLKRFRLNSYRLTINLNQRSCKDEPCYNIDHASTVRRALPYPYVAEQRPIIFPQYV